MKLREICSASGRLNLTGWAKEATGWVVSAAKGDDSLRPVTVVVPTPYGGISLRRSLGSSIGLTNVRFMGMPRLAEFLGSPLLAEQGKVPLSLLVDQDAVVVLVPPDRVYGRVR